MFYSVDDVLTLRNENTSNSTANITSALETFSIQRSEQGGLFLRLTGRKQLLENYYRVGYENPDEATGKFVLHPPGSSSSIASKQHLDYILKREAKGNPLSALRSLWGESGELYDNPEALADIYKVAGYPHEISQSNAPWYSAQGVFKGNVLADNPLFTSNTEGLQKLIPELEQEIGRAHV